MENFILLETRSKVLKVPRRTFPRFQPESIQISVQSYSSKKKGQNQSWFSAMFGNSEKFIGSESASKIYNTIRVPNQVSNTTSGTKFGVLRNKI